MALAAFPQQQQVVQEVENGSGTLVFKPRASAPKSQQSWNIISSHICSLSLQYSSIDIFIYFFICIQLEFFWPDYVSLGFLSSHTFRGNQSAAILNGFHAVYLPYSAVNHADTRFLDKPYSSKFLRSEIHLFFINNTSAYPFGSTEEYRLWTFQNNSIICLLARLQKKVWFPSG